MSHFITLLSGLRSRAGLLRVRTCIRRTIWARVAYILVILSLLTQNSAQAIGLSGTPAAQGSAPAWGTITKQMTQAAPPVYSLVARPFPSDSTDVYNFGYAASLSGDTLVVGDPAYGDAAHSFGAAFVFYRDQGGTDAWGEVAKLTPPDGMTGDEFGLAVAADGDIVVVGAWLADDGSMQDQGAAYVFSRNQGGADAWGLVSKLTAFDGDTYDMFGRQVSVSGDTIVVGMTEFSNHGEPYKGAAYVFNRDPVSGAWLPGPKLTAFDGADGDRFGGSVSVSGDTIFVGAPRAAIDGIQQGAAYVFYRDPVSGMWTPGPKLTGGFLGGAVSVSGDTAVVGSGAAYVFYRDRVSNSWQQVALLDGDPTANEFFGQSVSLSGNTIIVGAPRATIDGRQYNGAAYIFSRNRGGANAWGLVDKLVGDGANGHFGEGVSVSGNMVAVGAYGGGSLHQEGEAFVYESTCGGSAGLQAGSSLGSAMEEHLERTPTPEASMRPHPDLSERAHRGEITLPNEVLLEQKGIDLAQPKGNWKALALLVQFTDNPAQVSATDFDTLLFGGGFGTLTHYYNTVSYGVLNLVTVNLPSSIGWSNMPRNYAYYMNGKKGQGAYPQNAQKLAEDAVCLADPLVDFSQYDNDGDGFVDAVFIIVAGPGFERTGNPNYIHSHTTETKNPPIVDGVTVRSFSIEPEYWKTPGDMTVGVFAHELGHLFGLPDLYDGDKSSYGVGRWSLMGRGSWNGPGQLGGSPAFLDAWSRAQLGFVNPTVIKSNTTGSSIPAAETSNTVYRLWTNGKIGSEYFLVENRQRTSYDTYLPQAGLLIWHIDQNKPDNKTECRQLNNWQCGSDHYKVALEQADGQLELENHGNVGDTSDPYPGDTNNRSFTFTSSPNSSSYYANDTDTFVRVMNISNSGTTMTANFQVRPLLRNPSFENDTNIDGRPDGWSPSVMFTRSTVIPAIHGNYAGRFGATNNANGVVNQVVGKVLEGSIYDFSGWVNIPATSDTFTFKLQVVWRRADNTVISTSPIQSYSTKTVGWSEAKASMVAPPGAANAVVKMIVSNLNATIYVDKFSFLVN
jgi:immune inhibitor A